MLGKGEGGGGGGVCSKKKFRAKEVNNSAMAKLQVSQQHFIVPEGILWDTVRRLCCSVWEQSSKQETWWLDCSSSMSAL